MVKKKVLVLGLVIALMVGNGSVYASTISDNSIANPDSVIVSAAGVPAKIVCNSTLLVPAGTKITGEMLLNHLTVVDSNLKDLGMKDQLRFSDGRGNKISADAKAADLNAMFKSGLFTATDENASLDGYTMVFAHFVVKYEKAKEVGVPYAFKCDNTLVIPKGTELTADMLMAHFRIVDAAGTDLNISDKFRIIGGKGELIAPDKAAAFLNTRLKESTTGSASFIPTVEGYTNIFREGCSVKYSDEVATSGKIEYSTHVQNEGWQSKVKDGKMSGTEARSLRLEGIKIESGIAGVGVEYTTHVQDIGWQDYVANGVMSGTSARSLRLEAIKIRLTGENAAKYDVYYRVHAQNVGWMGWASNDAESGTAGFGYRLEGIEIKIVEKGSPAPGSVVNPFLQNK